MNEPTNDDTDPYFLQMCCEMAAYLWLRPITWRQELIDGLPTFSDFISVRTDLDGRDRSIVLPDDPSDWIYLFVFATPRMTYDVRGWISGHEAKHPRFRQVGQDRRSSFLIPQDPQILRPRKL